MSKLFAIYDSKANYYSPPISFKSRGEAIRSFSDTANSATKDNQIARHPSDFHLFEIADYDEETAHIELLESKINLGCAIEYIRDSFLSDYKATQSEIASKKKEEFSQQFTAAQHQSAFGDKQDDK